MANVYSLNTIEFHWDGKDGVVRNNGKYGLLLTKPSIPSVLFDTVSYVSDVVGSVGGFGITTISLNLHGMCNEGQYLLFDFINVTPSTGSDSLPMYVAIADSANAKTNDLKLSMVCWDSAMDTKQNKVRLYIRACAGVENVDFGLGELFPEINHRRT